MSHIEIITIGDELTEGRLIDTNAGEMSEVLTRLGLVVWRHTSVPDEVDAIVDALREGASRSDAVLISGGLGPTTDDLTAECAARAFELPVVRFPEALEHTRAIFQAIGREMTPNNEKQADLPETSTIIPNPAGTAVGFRVIIGGCRLYFMPGVPREMRGMLNDWIVPDLQDFLSLQKPLVSTLKIYGLGESKVGHLIETLTQEVPHPAHLLIQYRATFPEIHVRLVLRGIKEEEGGEMLLAHLTQEAESRLSPHVYATGGVSLPMTFPEVVLADARRLGGTIAVAESCTGGMIGEQLTTVPGSSDVFLGGVVTYANSAKIELLGVDPELLATHGAVSGPVAEHMATSIRERLGATWAVSATGIAGPGGGSPTKPVGTVFIGIASPQGVYHRQLTFPRDRERVRTMTTWSALALLRRTIRNETSS